MFWKGIAAATIVLLVNFASVRRTLFVRAFLLILGLVGVSVTAYKYHDDQQRAAPRHLSGRKTVRIVEELKPFSGQQFQIVTYPKCEECSTIFVLIYNPLIQSEWVRAGPPVGIPIGAMQSVIVSANNMADRQFKHAAHVLTKALNREGIAARLESDTEQLNIVDIVIGLKP